jgi:2-keto-4-pentenoate hydratase
MEAAKIKAYTDTLFQAERNRKAVAPLTDQDSSITVDDAYQIQLENVKTVLAMGHTISGKKIGLTSPGIQKQMGVSEPDYGHLYAAMDCKDGKVNTAALLQPKLEGEIAFVLKADLAGGRVTREDVGKVYKNRGELVGEGTGAVVMGDPCISGAFFAAPVAARGDSFRAEFSILGVVEAQFI